jgi:hypothetical protein
LLYFQPGNQSSPDLTGLLNRPSLDVVSVNVEKVTLILGICLKIMDVRKNCVKFIVEPRPRFCNMRYYFLTDKLKTYLTDLLA